MARTRRPPNPREDFVRYLWRAPLLAVPFALFFSLLFGPTWETIRQSYLFALVFSYTIGFAIWLVSWWEIRQEGATGPRSSLRGKAIVLSILRYMGAGILASYVAAAIIHFAIMPGFLGSTRSLLLIGAFSIVFAALFTGIAFAWHFYEHALARVRAEEELSLARRIQRSFLRSHFPASPGLEIHALNVSSKQVSGDFYDVVPAGDQAFLLCIADVSGKGVPAALLCSMLQAALRTQAPVVSSVARILENVNRMICDASPNGQFATVFLARIEEDSLRMTYVNAGHNYPIVFRPGVERVALDRGGIPIGVLEAAAFDEGSFQLEPGDRVLLYTDGVSEAMDGQKGMFGEDRLYELTDALSSQLSARESIDEVLAGLRRFLAGEEPQDDITLMMLRVLEKPAAMARVPAAAAGASLIGGVRP